MIVLIILIFWTLLVAYFLYQLSLMYFARERLPACTDTDLSDFKCPTLKIIIPARNEAFNIKECVKSLVNLNYPKEKYEVIIVNDNSTDDTAIIVEEQKKQFSNLRLLSCPELPAGWTGKAFACMTGVSSIDSNQKPEWYCFIDADTRITSGDILKSALAFAQTRKLDLLSLIPHQEMVSPVERLLLPSLFLGIASSVSFSKINDPRNSDALANGQFLLFKGDTYLELEGHQAVKSQIMEDIYFARLMKEKGKKLYCLFAENFLTTRMYRNFQEIFGGLSKNMIEIMRKTGLLGTLYVSIKSLCLGLGPIIIPIWVALPLLNGTQSASMIEFYFTLAAGILPSVFLLIFNVMTSLEFKIPFWYGLLFPLGFVLHSILILTSYYKIKKGKRVWKGRIYPPSCS